MYNVYIVAVYQYSFSSSIEAVYVFYFILHLVILKVAPVVIVFTMIGKSNKSIKGERVYWLFASIYKSKSLQ